MECAGWTGGDQRIAIGEADGHLWIRGRRGCGQEVRSDPLKGLISVRIGEKEECLIGVYIYLWWWKHVV